MFLHLRGERCHFVGELRQRCSVAVGKLADAGSQGVRDALQFVLHGSGLALACALIWWRDNAATLSWRALPLLNGRWGRGTLQIAGAGGGHRKWEMKQERKTPSYTTDWRGLVVAR